MDGFSIRRAWAIAWLALALMGCGRSTTKASLSERQRDSVISRSSLPGASTVGRALEQSDAASQRAANLDSLAQ
jgi:hypothetical protein